MSTIHHATTTRTPFGPRETSFRLSEAAAAIRDLDGLGEVPAVLVEESPLLLGPAPVSGEGVSLDPAPETTEAESAPLFSGTLAPMVETRPEFLRLLSRRAVR